MKLLLGEKKRNKKNQEKEKEKKTILVYSKGHVFVNVQISLKFQNMLDFL